MTQFNIAEAKTHFSEIVQKAMLGEDIVIAKDNKPILKLVPLSEPGKNRKPGSAKGQILHMADGFNDTPDHFKDYV